PQNETFELAVGESALDGEVAERGRPNREPGGELTVAAAGGAVARRARRRVSPLALADQPFVGAQRRHVRGHGPAVLGRERLFDLRHRRARYPDRELAV